MTDQSLSPQLVIPLNSPLSLLLSAYFNEEWPEVNGTPGDTVRDFRARYLQEDVDEAGAQVRGVLALTSDVELEAAFDEVCCSYYIDPDELTVRQFLTWIGEALAEPLDQPPSQPPDWPPDE